MKTILIFADTVCRRYLSMYGCQETRTPNLQRLADRGVVFDNHWCGSAPCLPARRDLFTGRLNFLERNWGGAEPFDHLLPKLLRDRKNVYSHLVTDHMFYLTQGGENLHNSFSSYKFLRGQEHDPLVPVVNQPVPPPHHGLFSSQYCANRTAYHSEEDFPSPKTFQSALEWLDLNRDADNYFLMVESFDPHEPFDTPEKYLEMYPDGYQGEEYFWPHYGLCDDTPEQNLHIHHRYYATLTMMDHWLGKLLDKLDEYSLWDDTAVIFTTDHGFMLGEHGFMAKNYMPAYNEVFHIPLIVCLPGLAPGRCGALTQNIDLFPTILEWFGIPASSAPNKLHGRSLLPLLRGEAESIHPALLYGYYGRSVNITDGRYTYFRAAQSPDNQPLFLYTAMPATLRENLGWDTMTPEGVEKIECGRFLRWTDYPVLKIPAAEIDYKNESQSFTVRNEYNSESLLFDLSCDYAQEHPIQDEALEGRMARLLRQTMEQYDAPKEQYQRLGLQEDGGQGA